MMSGIINQDKKGNEMNTSAVTDAMVEAAHEAFWNAIRTNRECMRAALEAALSVSPVNEQSSPQAKLDKLAEEDGLVDDLDTACSLIQEAKGLADSERGGPVTDHLDFAETFINKAIAALRSRAPAEQVAVRWEYKSEYNGPWHHVSRKSFEIYKARGFEVRALAVITPSNECEKPEAGK